MNQYIEETKKGLVHTYNRFPVVLERGEGVYLYDTEGKRYLDFAAGIAVCGLGYGNQELNRTLKEQIDALTHTSNLYYNTTCGKAAGALKRITGMDRVFFTNSGTEAIEGALKAARKYAWKKGTGRYEFIAMEDSFHGRSIGAVSVTGSEAYRTPFEPMLPGVRFAKFNDLESVKAQITDRTCAIILEPLQGEGGIHPASQEFMEGIREICDKEGILMICDEIQCGMGRSGHMFAWQGYDVKPDAMSVAKALGNGVPVGAFLARGKAAAAMVPGDHGTTYGGNPLVGAAVDKVLEIMERDKLADHAKEMGDYLWKRLEELRDRYDFVIAHRGLGLMQGLQITLPVGEVSAKALSKGLVLITAGSDVLRFVPPLIIEKEDVDTMTEILTEVFEEMK